MCEGHVEQRSPVLSHKLFGSLSSVSHAETLSPVSQWTSCPGENGQYNDDGIYQLSGGLRSRQLHVLAHRLTLWSSKRLLSLRATHVPGALNQGADLLSRGVQLYGEWTLHPAIAEQGWARFGRAVVDLFALRENTLSAVSLNT